MRDLFVVLVLLGTLPALAQSNRVAEVKAASKASQARGDALSALDHARMRWHFAMNHIITTAGLMPEEHYHSKPTPEGQSFRDVVAHAADSAIGMCTMLMGKERPSRIAGNASKTELLAALERGRAACEEAYGALDGDNANDFFPGGRGPLNTRVGLLWQNTAHISHHYGRMTVYLRLNGLDPPTAPHD